MLAVSLKTSMRETVKKTPIDFDSKQFMQTKVADQHTVPQISATMMASPEINSAR